MWNGECYCALDSVIWKSCTADGDWIYFFPSLLKEADINLTSVLNALLCLRHRLWHRRSVEHIPACTGNLTPSVLCQYKHTNKRTEWQASSSFLSGFMKQGSRRRNSRHRRDKRFRWPHLFLHDESVESTLWLMSYPPPHLWFHSGQCCIRKMVPYVRLSECQGAPDVLVFTNVQQLVQIFLDSYYRCLTDAQHSHTPICRF